MDAVIEHTYWDKNFKEDPQFGDKFFQAIGNSSANSKIWFRQWLKLNPEITSFKNCLDIGCGPATEFEGFKTDEITIDYTGVDSSAHLCNFNSKVIKTSTIEARAVSSTATRTFVRNRMVTVGSTTTGVVAMIPVRVVPT